MKKTNKIMLCLKKRLINFFNNYPKIERALDLYDEFFQKILPGYVIAIILMLFILFGIAYNSLPSEIKAPFSPVISIIITAILIPFFLSIYNRKKENETKLFENNKELYLKFSKILLPILFEQTFTSNEKDKILNCIEENQAEIAISFSPKMIATINAIINNCNDRDNQNIFYYSKKLIKQMRKEAGNTNFSLALLNTKRNNNFIKK